MAEHDVIIIGAGAAGLMAAQRLSAAGRKVCVLEARERSGGRICTLHDPAFAVPIEAGAEFIHGKLPLTLQLLTEAGIPYRPTEGTMWQAKNGSLQQGGYFIQDWTLFEEQLKKLEEDMPINTFLHQYFPGNRYTALRNAVRRYAAGYDTADPDLASAFALRDEWLHTDEQVQYRIPGGYSQLTDFLAEQVRSSGGDIRLSSPVQAIHWQQGHVQVITATGDTEQAARVIVAVPLGVLQRQDSRNTISFSPAVDEKINAANHIGFGAIIKIILQFEDAFWEKSPGKEPDRHIGFIFSDEAIPTWWTQLPDPAPVLTGWLGGAGSASLLHTTDEAILEKALASLATIFSMQENDLRQKLKAWHIMNWTADPFTRGSYSYATLATAAAVKHLSTPVEGTIFFSGEALYEGPAMGTVEAALVSGLQTAEQILA